VNHQIYEEASEWLVELRVGDMDASARERLDAWFRASPENLRAFLELANIWEEGSGPELDSGHSTEALVSLARVSTNVVALGAASPKAGTMPQHLFESEETTSLAQGAGLGAPTTVSEFQTTPGVSPSATRSLWARRHLAVAASLAFVTIAATALILHSVLTPTYATGIGEQRAVELPDGSTVKLNAQSRLRVRFTDHERNVELLAGQALFKVAKNATRPFVVLSDGARVRAVGTQFDMFRRTIGTTVTVVEGQVAVLPSEAGIASPVQEPAANSSAGSVGPEIGVPATASPAILVSAGEQVTVTPTQVTKPTHADVASATAWTKRELVFDLTPLTDVVAEFNRYNAKPLIVSDASLKEFHVTGVFSSTDPSSLLKFLRAQPRIAVIETESGIRITSK